MTGVLVWSVRTSAFAALWTVIVTLASSVMQYGAVTVSSWPSPPGEKDCDRSPAGRESWSAIVTGWPGDVQPWPAPNWSV